MIHEKLFMNTNTPNLVTIPIKTTSSNTTKQTSSQNIIGKPTIKNIIIVIFKIRSNVFNYRYNSPQLGHNLEAPAPQPPQRSIQLQPASLHWAENLSAFSKPVTGSHAAL